MLDLVGWFWDEAHSAKEVVACDALDWADVRGLPSWSNLVDATVGPYEYRESVSLLDPALLPQCKSFLSLRAVDPEEIPEGTTVFLPFVLNHLFGRNGHSGLEAWRAFEKWLKTLVDRACRILIADMHASKATGFWRQFDRTFRMSNAPADLYFYDSIGEVASLYDGERLQRRRGSTHMSSATVLVIEGSTGSYLS